MIFPATPGFRQGKIKVGKLCFPQDFFEGICIVYLYQKFPIKTHHNTQMAFSPPGPTLQCLENNFKLLISHLLAVQ